MYISVLRLKLSHILESQNNVSVLLLMIHIGDNYSFAQILGDFQTIFKRFSNDLLLLTNRQI